jgi:hypothetical protein
MELMPMINRWMAEISYRDSAGRMIVYFEELRGLQEIVELGPDWNDIEEIVITLNRPSREPRPESRRPA